MLMRPSSYSQNNLFYLTNGRYHLTENSAHRLDRSAEIYSVPHRMMCFALLNGISNIRASSGTEVNVYSEVFYNTFLKME